MIGGRWPLIRVTPGLIRKPFRCDWIGGVNTVRKAIVDQPEARDGIGGSTPITQQAGETRRSAHSQDRF